MDDRARQSKVGRKVCGGLLCPFPRGRAGSPSNTMSPRPRLPPYQVAPWSIQPFGHNTPTLQTERTDRTTVPYSIRQTVTCNGRPKNLYAILKITILTLLTSKPPLVCDYHVKIIRVHKPFTIRRSSNCFWKTVTAPSYSERFMYSYNFHVVVTNKRWFTSQ